MCLGGGGCRGSCLLHIMHLNSKNQLVQRETSASQSSSTSCFVSPGLCISAESQIFPNVMQIVLHHLCTVCACVHAYSLLFSWDHLHGCDVDQSGVQSFAVQTPQGKCTIPVFICLLSNFPLGAVTVEILLCPSKHPSILQEAHKLNGFSY